MLISCAALLAFPLLAGQAKQAKTRHTYQPGVVIGWSSTPASTSTYTVRDKYGGVHPRPVYSYGRKFYELQGKDMIYMLNNCGKVKPKQAVQYRTDGDWLYIARDKEKEYKCRIMGEKSKEAPNQPVPHS